MKNKIYGMKYLEKTKNAAAVEGGKIIDTTVSAYTTYRPPEPTDISHDNDLEVLGLIIGLPMSPFSVINHGAFPQRGKKRLRRFTDTTTGNSSPS